MNPPVERGWRELAEDWELLYLALHPEMYGDVVLRKI
jgi:hypothetical protein